ncbi:MAG: hypothetical protein IJ467_02975 [Bacteroidaceae bacterium]|nr:hypothetical protein [Bacteroidaceae bacterium]
MKHILLTLTFLLGISQVHAQGLTEFSITGKNVGEAYLSWWKRYNGNSHSETEIHWSYGMTILGDPTINLRHEVRNFCESELTLNSFPDDNQSNLIMYKAAQSIYVSGQFIIPEGVHVIFDAPEVVFGDNFSCPIGASFETRNEGCKL